MTSTTDCFRQETSHSKVDREKFRAEIDGRKTDLFYLTNKNGLEITVTNFGARIVEFWTPDKTGHFEDIVLGHDHLDAYVDYGTGERFFGATIGRYGNRMAKGRFSLDGVEYCLPLNNGPNSLHGGEKGFDSMIWDTEQTDCQNIVFSYRSVDGEQGYPGNLDVGLTYQLNDNNELVITHTARTDKKTVINLTHHSFFNLHGAGNGTINDHLLTLHASHYTPVDSTLIPSGEVASVEGTPMDFRKPTLIGERVDEPFQQLKHGNGYDHNWVLDRHSDHDLELATELYEPESGRFINVLTTEPGIQFYGGNFLDGSILGKGGKAYFRRAAIALETQHFPDSPNHLNFPSTVLNPEETYKHICIYKTGVR